MTISIIWDVDGTLINSYDSIVDCIVKTIEHFNIHYDATFIRDMIQKESTKYFLEYAGKNNNVNGLDLWDYYNSLIPDISMISLMPEVKETLAKLYKIGINNFIYTHRGKSVYEIISNLDIKEYFVEVVNMDNGFKRKPSPEAIDYLITKYNLSKDDTYYVGDRIIDQICAKNAGINSMYYQSYEDIELNDGDYDIMIKNISELLEII